MTRRILLVEDDAETAGFVARGLREAGFTVEPAANGRDALYAATGGGFDLIVLDRMVPGLDGLSLLKSLRAAGLGVPVLMLTALGSVDDRVEGLRAGADDYLPKPFSFEELLARAEALLRRPSETSEETRLSVADLEMDLISRTVTRAGGAIHLLPREFQMLEYLMRRAGRVVTRTMLLEALWDYHFDPETNVIDVHISRLRKKVDAAGAPLIQTVRGAGYMIAKPG